jgi:hypothetical protein
MAGVDDVRPSPLGEQWLPLPIAAALAYYEISGTRVRLPERSVDEAVRRTAVALATVAPIYMTIDGGAGAFVLSPSEIDELLFKPLESGERPSLDNLRIRKADMQKAVATLKASREGSSG